MGDSCASERKMKFVRSDIRLEMTRLTLSTLRKRNRFLASLVSLSPTVSNWPRGPMDKASAHGAGDWRFESYWGHCLDTLLMVTSRKEAIMLVIKLLCCGERNEVSFFVLLRDLLLPTNPPFGHVHGDSQPLKIREKLFWAPCSTSFGRHCPRVWGFQNPQYASAGL